MYVLDRVARFFVTQYTKTGENVPKALNYKKAI
jgi:hypothetical protein